MRVDVRTTSKDLEEIMIKHYPLRRQIFEQNVDEFETEDGQKVYCFLGLDKDEVEKFLNPFGDKYMYVIIPSLGAPRVVEGVNIN